MDIYARYGYYKESLLSVVRKGQSGAQEIQQMMASYRLHPPVEINGSRVIKIKDYQTRLERDLIKNTETALDLPRSNVLQFFTADGSVVSIRPSGTEPKIKFYFGVRETLKDRTEFEETGRKLDARLQDIISSLNLR
jgi:phosphoglucomutase